MGNIEKELAAKARGLAGILDPIDTNITNEELNEIVKLRLEAQMAGVAAVLNEKARQWRDTPDCVAAIQSVADGLGVKLDETSLSALN